MMTTPQRTQPAAKSADRDLPRAKHSDHPAEKPNSASRIEPRDWRGEGVVGDIHTD